VIAATNRDLRQMVADREFRSDLYYRLNVFPIDVPPLRERTEDIQSLVRHFVSKYARRMKKTLESIPSHSMEALTRYAWPGNIRELENFIERAVILSPGPTLQIPLAELKQSEHASSATQSMSLTAAEAAHIQRVLKETNGVIGGPSGAAARLGMKRTTLHAKIKKLGISRPA
jgi:formate hydrogenlyase transcriptional activator